jgi:hypothetical protein
MRKLLGLATLLAMFCCDVQAERLPFAPIPLPDYLPATTKAPDARLKISVALDTVAETTPALSLGGIVVCSKTACYKPNTRAARAAANASAGGAMLVADSTVPYTQIDKVYFEEPKQGGVGGAIELSRPLNVEKGYYGGELFITVKPGTASKTAAFVPSFATSNLLREKGRSIYYNPRFAATVTLDFGVTIKIPAGALPNPEILNAKADDVGDAYPQVDIYPYVGFAKNASISAKVIQRQSIGTNPSGAPTVRTAPLPGASQSAIGTGTSSAVEKNISRSGVFSSGVFEGPQASLAPSRAHQAW